LNLNIDDFFNISSKGIVYHHKKISVEILLMTPLHSDNKFFRIYDRYREVVVIISIISLPEKIKKCSELFVSIGDSFCRHNIHFRKIKVKTAVRIKKTEG
jgi:hypothetical protein